VNPPCATRVVRSVETVECSTTYCASCHGRWHLAALQVLPSDHGVLAALVEDVPGTPGVRITRTKHGVRVQGPTVFVATATHAVRDRLEAAVRALHVRHVQGADALEATHLQVSAQAPGSLSIPCPVVPALPSVSVVRSPWVCMVLRCCAHSSPSLPSYRQKHVGTLVDIVRPFNAVACPSLFDGSAASALASAAPHSRAVGRGMGVLAAVDVGSSVRVEVRAGDYMACAAGCALVNPSNSALVHGGGLAAVIDRAAGPKYVAAARACAPLLVGAAKATAGFNLSSAGISHVIHTGAWCDATCRSDTVAVGGAMLCAVVFTPAGGFVRPCVVIPVDRCLWCVRSCPPLRGDSGCRHTAARVCEVGYVRGAGLGAAQRGRVWLGCWRVRLAGRYKVSVMVCGYWSWLAPSVCGCSHSHMQCVCVHA
jgi:hypothetical protein